MNPPMPKHPAGAIHGQNASVDPMTGEAPKQTQQSIFGKDVAVTPQNVKELISKASPPPRCTKEHKYATKHGVYMNTVEDDATIMEMSARAFHVKFLPPPESVFVTRRRGITTDDGDIHNATFTMSSATAQDIGTPIEFDYAAVQRKVRDPNYDFSISDRDNDTLEGPAPTAEALALCTRDEDGSYRAPEEEHASEERLHLFYLLDQY